MVLGVRDREGWEAGRVGVSGMYYEFKRYWLTVWYVLIWDYAPGIQLARKLKWLAWAIFTPWIAIPYFLFAGLSWMFEKLWDVFGDIAMFFGNIPSNTVPKSHKKEAPHD